MDGRDFGSRGCEKNLRNCVRFCHLGLHWWWVCGMVVIRTDVFGDVGGVSVSGVNEEDEDVGSVGVEVFAGRGAGEALRLDRSGGVVVKWLGAGVVSAGDGGPGVDDGNGVARGDVVGDAGCDADAPRRLIDVERSDDRAGLKPAPTGLLMRGEDRAGLKPAPTSALMRGRSRLTIRAAVGSEDRKGDVIDPSGWELEGYRRNPVFLWAHDRSRPPIGKSQRIWVEDDALYAEVEFAPTDFAGEIAGLYERGFMRGVSVGFLPLETEVRKASNGRRGYLYRRQELLEISAVPVPMHDGALAGIPRSLRSRPLTLREGEVAVAGLSFGRV